MTGLEGHLEIANATDFEKRFGLPRARVDQLEDDTWYELARGHLFKLLALESEVRKDHPDFVFFRLEPNPLWETFANAGGVGLTGIDLENQPVRIDLNLVAAFSNAGITLPAPPAGVSVTDLMRTKNCVIVGSPKCNAATETALNALFPTDPPAIAFHWPHWGDTREETRISKRGPHRINFIDQRGEMRHEDDHSPNGPVGALVVCRCPLQTAADVTTIIAAGCTRYGTLQIVQDLLSGDVHVPRSHVQRGQPQVLILMAKDRGKRWRSVEGERHLHAKRAERREKVKRGDHAVQPAPTIVAPAMPDQVAPAAPPKRESERSASARSAKGLPRKAKRPIQKPSPQKARTTRPPMRTPKNKKRRRK